MFRSELIFDAHANQAASATIPGVKMRMNKVTRKRTVGDAVTTAPFYGHCERL